MEYEYYLEQRYDQGAGVVRCRVLTALQAEEKGYEDGYICTVDGCRTYVDGFDSENTAKRHVESLNGAVLIGG